MRSFQRKLAILSYDTAHLLILISELNELRERLKKAEQSAQKVRRKRTRIERSAIPEGAKKNPPA
jgi:hypothetical protein